MVKNYHIACELTSCVYGVMLVQCTYTFTLCTDDLGSEALYTTLHIDYCKLVRCSSIYSVTLAVDHESLQEMLYRLLHTILVYCFQEEQDGWRVWVETAAAMHAYVRDQG